MFDRLFTISKAYINHHIRKKRSFASSHGDSQSDASDATYREQETSHTQDDPFRAGAESTSNRYDLPKQVLDDLALFEIAPPGSWSEVVKARNREMKRYHPDKYMNASNKVDAANEIAQIYNAAFERLKKYFNK